MDALAFYHLLLFEQSRIIYYAKTLKLGSKYGNLKHILCSEDIHSEEQVNHLL